MPTISAPVALTSAHDLTSFDSGQPTLDDWLRNRALASEGKSARSFVACEGSRVVGYYCIATGAVSRDTATPKKLRHGLPDSVPVMLLARLAVDLKAQGQGIGGGLLRDALLRMLNASTQIGARAALVHAINDSAVAFYKAYGFREFPAESRTLFLPVEHIAAALGNEA